MVFKRRDPLSWRQWLTEFFWPSAGWKRATSYAWHRLRRLPDPPHRIARGMFAGAFVGFLPIPGFQFIVAALIAWGIRGNLIAALLGTFLSNPFTTPFYAWASLEAGYFMLGNDFELTIRTVFVDSANATAQLWDNSVALFTGQPAEWDRLTLFWRQIFLPYLLGGIPAGIAGGLIAYYATIPIVDAYQRAKARKAEKRRARALAARAEALLAAQDTGSKPDGADGGFHAD